MTRLKSNSFVVGVSVLALVGVVGCAPSTEMATQVEPAAPANPYVGVWQVESLTAPDGTALDAQPQTMTFANDHFSVVAISGPEMPPKPATPFQPTAEEAMAILAANVAGAGTYTVDGSQMTLRFTNALMPSMVGGTVTLQADATGDTMTLRILSVTDVDGASPPNLMQNTMTFRRLE